MAPTPDFFTLNLGHDSIKVAQLKQSPGRAKLVNLGSTRTSAGLLENESDQGLDMLAKEIDRTTKESGIDVKNCVISVPEVQVFSRLITLPKVKDEEVSDTVHYALKPLVPVPLENVNVSFLEIDETKVNEVVYTNWYAVAAPKQLIAKFQVISEKIGLNLFAIETEALAIARMVDYSYGKEVQGDVVILDLGSDSSNVILSRKGVVMFSQNIGTGSDALTKVIAADYGLDSVQAEKYKVTYGMDMAANEGKIAKSLEPIINIMISELTRTINYYKEKIGGAGITNIFLTGGGSGLPHLDQYIINKVGIQTLVADPLKNLEVDSKANQKLQSMNVKSFNVAIGLGLKGVV